MKCVNAKDLGRQPSQSGRCSFGSRSELQSEGDEDYYVEESFSILPKMTEMVFQVSGGGGDLGLGIWYVR